MLVVGDGDECCKAGGGCEIKLSTLLCQSVMLSIHSVGSLIVLCGSVNCGRIDAVKVEVAHLLNEAVAEILIKQNSLNM